MQKNQRLRRERRSTEMMMNYPHLNTGTCTVFTTLLFLEAQD